MLKIGLIAGSFDPFTCGHYDIAMRASRLFDKIIIGVAKNTGNKNCKADISERVEIAKLSVKLLKNVEVIPFDGFLVDFAILQNADSIVRGLRTSNDFEYEKVLTEVYKSQSKKIETMYLISSHNYSHISGSIVRELGSLGGSIKGYVHEDAIECVMKYYGQQNK